jgi:hypothetical protein
MPDQPEKKEIPIHVNPMLPTVFVDHLVVSKRSDGGLFLRMIAELPEGWTEQARLMVSEERLKKFMDVICAQLDYYPQKAKSNGKAVAKDAR